MASFDADSFVGGPWKAIAQLQDELRRALALKGTTRPPPPPSKPRRRRKGTFRKYVVIPDTQCKPGVPLEHLTWAGRYIAKHKPDVIVHLGDHWDMESLSSYDKGKKSFEGRRYKADVEAGNLGMAMLTKPYRRLRSYNPEEHITLGNHEDRITRLLEIDPIFEGVVGIENLALDGWHVHQFRVPVKLDGVLFSHYFYSPLSGRAWGGRASNILNHVGCSFVQGHRQVLDVATKQLPDGSRRRGIIAGAFYQHDEDYLGPQAQGHWRGILVLNEVHDGDFDLMEVSMDFLRRRYG